MIDLDRAAVSEDNLLRGAEEEGSTTTTTSRTPEEGEWLLQQLLPPRA